MVARKTLHRLGASAPDNLEELTRIALQYNAINPRGFVVSYRCISFFLDGSRILTMGRNIMKTHPFAKEYADNLAKTIHAEINGLMVLKKNDMIPYVTDIVSVRGKSRALPSMPCKTCMKYLKEYFPERRLWGINDKRKWELVLL